MAELVSKPQFQQALQNAIKPGKKPEDRSANGAIVTRYVGQLEANAEQTVKQIEELRGQVLKLEGEAAESVPKTELERVEKEAAETRQRLETEMAELREQLATAQSEENPRVVELKGQLEQLEKARQEAVGSLEEMSHEATVPQARFDEVQRRVEELGLEIEELTAQLKLAQSEENPRVVELKEQIAQLGTAHEQATLKQQQVVEQLQAEVRELTRAAENHPREIEEITRRADGEALKVEALQVEMRRYQEVALEVARTPHGKVAALLEETGRQHAEIVGDSTQEQADKAFLTHKIHLLEAKQAEYEAAHRTGAEEALRSPELALKRQSEIFRAQREQMAMDADILTTPEAAIAKRHEEIRVAHEKLAAARVELGDVESQGVDVQLRALDLDRQVAQLASQLQMLETLQKTLQEFVEVGRGQAGLGLTELHRVTSESLRVETERLAGLRSEEAEARDEGAIAVQAEKVRGLEAQVEQLRVAVESYQEHAATQVAIDAQFLQRLVSIAPATVPAEEKLTFILHAVQAIVQMQQILTPGFGPDATHHLKIQSLLEQIDIWNGQYLDITDSSVAALREGVRDELTRSLRYKLPNVLQTIVVYTQMPAANIGDEIMARRAAIFQLDAEFGLLDAVDDHTRDERAIRDNRVLFAIESIYLNTLLAIQGVHQPLLDAHAVEKTDLEWQKTVLGTMQRLIVGFFSMLFSIPGMMIGGLQTMGHPIVSKK